VPLSEQQVAELNAAVGRYSFPAVYFDFAASTPVQAPNIRVVEEAIRGMLVSQVVEVVRDGLANVIYWGYAQIGYRDVRVDRFRNGVTVNQLTRFQALIAAGVPSLSQIKALNIPEYSGISFLSKILAFLDPAKYCVLDQQLARLGMGPGGCALHRLTHGTRIEVTTNNEAVYNSWRAECCQISASYFGGRHRVVDVERGFFQLVQTNQLPLAQRIYSAA
jgi:hypothetical protein